MENRPLHRRWRQASSAQAWQQHQLIVAHLSDHVRESKQGVHGAERSMQTTTNRTAAPLTTPDCRKQTWHLTSTASKESSGILRERAKHAATRRTAAG
jgi:hypothetical protein